MVKLSEMTQRGILCEFLNEFYVAIRADEPEDSPARLLRDWILSDEGKAAIIKAGYIPV